MGILLAIIGIILGLIVLLMFIALFIKREYTVEREVDIAKPTVQVFDYIKYIKNQDQYSVWNQLDPNMQKTYTGADGTVGFMYAWDSQDKRAGKGEQQISSIKEGERVETALHFIRPFEGRSTAYMTTAATGGNSTKVKWGINGKMNYPMNIMLLVLNMEKMMGKDLSGGLNNLKALLEK
ncbi:MAG: SRPBCC family protein [Chitinophagaceae bacterium]